MADKDVGHEKPREESSGSESSFQDAGTGSGEAEQAEAEKEPALSYEPVKIEVTSAEVDEETDNPEPAPEEPYHGDSTYATKIHETSSAGKSSIVSYLE